MGSMLPLTTFRATRHDVVVVVVFFDFTAVRRDGFVLKDVHISVADLMSSVRPPASVLLRPRCGLSRRPAKGCGLAFRVR